MISGSIREDRYLYQYTRMHPNTNKIEGRTKITAMSSCLYIADSALRNWYHPTGIDAQQKSQAIEEKLARPSCQCIADSFPRVLLPPRRYKSKHKQNPRRTKKPSKVSMSIGRALREGQAPIAAEGPPARGSLSHPKADKKIRRRWAIPRVIVGTP